MVARTIMAASTGNNLFYNPLSGKSPYVKLNSASRPGGKGEKILADPIVRKLAVLMKTLI